MKNNILLLLPALIIASTASFADESSGYEVSGYLSATNDFMYRGLSLSGSGAAMMGEVTLQADSGFYTTLWGSNTTLRADDGSGSGLEGNLLVGYQTNLTGDLTLDVGYMRTFYPGMNGGVEGGARRDFNDFYGTLGYNGFEAGVSYSDDFFSETGSALYTFASYTGPIYNDLSLTATVGHTINDSEGFLGIFGVNEKSWTHYIIGVSHPLPFDMEISVSYHGTDSDGEDAFDTSGFGTNSFVAALTKTF
jgi:uncharacterized protein (TIGR02001 family)